MYVVLTIKDKGSRRREFIAYGRENREDYKIAIKYWSSGLPLGAVALAYGKSCFHEGLHNIVE